MNTKKENTYKTCPMCSGKKIIKVPADFQTCIAIRCRQCAGIGKVKVN